MVAFVVQHVWPDRHPAALVGVEALVEAAAAPQARRKISWCLSGWLTRALRDAWARGWQPADLPRMAARELSEAHRDVCRDAIALEARTYLRGAGEPDPDWLAQLQDLGALDARWADEDLLDDWAQATSLATLLLRVVELLALLARLPDQPVLMPPPNQWGGHRPSTGGPASGDDRVLARVRALLAKAESTEFPDEAEALSAKAQELISRHAVDRAVLAAGEARPVDVAGRPIPVDNPYPQPKSALLGTVATANRAKAVWSVHFGFSTVFGTPDDLAAVELLYTSLLTQATAAMLAAGSADRRRRLPSFRESFLGAYALRVGERLLDATDAAVDDGVVRHGDALLPVLARRSSAVEEAVAAAFPRTAESSLRSRNHDGWTAGLAAAELARLGPAGEVEGVASGDRPAGEPEEEQLQLLGV